MKEIERKFLVNEEKWNKIQKPKPIYIKQGYISKSENGVVRVRIKGEKAFLTIKSANFGIERHEFEYEIPVFEAEKMFELFCEKFIEKNRYEFSFDGKIWEIDEFIEPKQTFILAEIELTSEVEIFLKPEWLENEVSKDKMYFNSNLL
ncbi:MAG: CYTH domain-containing protein [Flavobacteriia bacterium]|jgi:adenylate cyclase